MIFLFLTLVFFFSSLVSSECTKTSAYVGATAPLVEQQHGVHGVVVIVDDCSFKVVQFYGDGKWPDGFWYGAPSTSELGDPSSITNMGTLEARAYDNDTLLVDAGKVINWGTDVKVISAWCRAFAISFATAELAPAGQCAAQVLSIESELTTADDSTQLNVRIECETKDVIVSIVTNLMTSLEGGGWVGVGFGAASTVNTTTTTTTSTTTNATMLNHHLIQVAGSNTIRDSIGEVGNVSVSAVQSSELLSYYSVAARLNVTFRSPSLLSSQFKYGELSVLFAINNNTMISSSLDHKHTYAMTLSNAFVPMAGLVQLEAETSARHVFATHAFFMLYGWTSLLQSYKLLMCEGDDNEKRRAVVVVVASRLSPLVAAFVAFIVAIVGVAIEHEPHFFRRLTLFTFHGTIGLLVMLGVVLGFSVKLAFDYSERLKSAVASSARVMRIAEILSQITFIAALVNLYLGTWMFSDYDPYAVTVSLTCWYVTTTFVAPRVVKRQSNVVVALLLLVVGGLIVSIGQVSALSARTFSGTVAGYSLPLMFLPIIAMWFFLAWEWRKGREKANQSSDITL